MVDKIIIDNNNLIVKRKKIIKRNLKVGQVEKNSLIEKYIIRNIERTNSSRYIKERDKLIVKLLIRGVEENNIIDLRISEVKNLKIEDRQKLEIEDFYNEYSKNVKNNFVFLESKRCQKISKSILNKIKNKYIKNSVRGSI